MLHRGSRADLVPFVAYCQIFQKSPPAPPREGSAYEGAKGDGCCRPTTGFKASAKKRVADYWGMVGVDFHAT
jgi:hypothetical protein